MTSFLVTNGTRPEVLEALKPTQLYLSLNAPDEDLYRRVSNPAGDLWPRIMESLSMLKDISTRTVVRMTVARGLNMHDAEGYARVLLQGEPDFVEVKAYMHLGKSRLRLSRDAMPEHPEVVNFAQKISDALGYKLADEVPLSRVALLSSGKTSQKIPL
jgi:tRNA wybutosine-synthesizing protein 1